MPASIGVNLRVTGHCRQGGRKYMEDFFSVAYQQTEDEKDLEYAFFGIYDGHGGAEAAAFAKEHLMESIVKQRGFWSEDDEEVLRSIKDGFIHTHLAMWKIHDKWPKTTSGLPSTAGTTASIAFIRRGKIYIGHVGDSGITLGYQEPGCPEWCAKPLTKDHKPECEDEMMRIEQSGGKVVAKSGVPRVVWNRPRIGHKGPVRRSTPIDEIPFLAVARSLGDLWSYNSALDEFVVSPTPDVAVIPIDTGAFRCLVFGTDGLYNMLSPNMAVHIVQQAERHNEQAALSDAPNKVWINPSKCLVEKALDRWSNTKMRADNTSVITLMLDPPGPPRAQVLRNKKNSTYSSSGLQIETRYQEREESKAEPETSPGSFDKKFTETVERDAKPDTAETPSTDISKLSGALKAEDKNFVPKPRESTAFETRPPDDPELPECSSEPAPKNDIQINEVSSSSVDAEEENRKGKRAKTERVQRNLRSATKHSDKEITSTRVFRKRDGEKNVKTEKVPEEKKPEERKKRLPLEESPQNVNRVLRERKNPPNDKNPMQKKKFGIKKLNLRGDKKKLLQNVLFRNKGPSNRKWTQKESKEKSVPSKSSVRTKENTTRVLRNSSTPSQCKPPPPPPASPPRPEKRRSEARAKPDVREVRKSTLAQKLRIHQETFKAKLRARPGSGRKPPKEKLLRLKKSIARRTR